MYYIYIHTLKSLKSQQVSTQLHTSYIYVHFEMKNIYYNTRKRNFVSFND